MGWETEGSLTNPGAGTLLADSGPMPPGQVELAILVWADAAADIVLQQRDPSNQRTLRSMIFGVRSVDRWIELPYCLPVATGERFRLVVRDALTGEIQGNLFWRR